MLANDYRRNPLYKAQVIDNYLGMRGVSGQQMLDRMQEEAVRAGAAFYTGRVVSVLPVEDRFMAALGDTMLEGRGPFWRPAR